MLLLSVFIGIAIATIVAAGAPLYLNSLQQLAFSASLDRLSTRFLTIHVFGARVPLTREALQEIEGSLTSAIDRNFSGIHPSYESYLRSDVDLVGLPERPLPEQTGTREIVSRGYFASLSNLETNSRFRQGRMARSDPASGPSGPVVEAVIATPTARSFDLDVGDVLTLTPAIDSVTRVSAHIVGVMEPDDPTSEYWNNVGILLDPPPLGVAPPRGVIVDLGEPPVVLIITREAMISAVGQSHGDSLVNPVWFIPLDKEPLKGWSVSEASRRLQGFEEAINEAMPRSSVATGVLGSLIDEVDRRSFFSGVPLLLLMAVVIMTAILFMFMMVSYLAQRRERDVALLRSRGVGTLHLLRLAALEGLVMTIAAVALAPFAAMGIVALAGRLPYFHDITGGHLLPLDIGPTPFLAAAGVGLLCLGIVVIRGALVSKQGLLVQKRLASRPPDTPFFQRYYLDVALLSLGGLTFWELHSRGNFISGGLFKDVEVNETLLLAPVLFLIVVAFVFMRSFPLSLRFVTGESAALLNLLTAATIVTLGAGIAVDASRDGGGVDWLGPAALLLGIGVAYWATNRASLLVPRVGGLAIQATLVGLFLTTHPLEPGDTLVAPTVALISIVPAQVAFLLLKASTKVWPVWLSMGLWHMTRNPFQYTWLVLLLVLAVGLGILATTVGGTLERSQSQRVRYDIGADIRISQFPGRPTGGNEAVRDRYLNVPGVTSASLAFRTTGSTGTATAEVLAIEARRFASMSWYRSDFSTRALGDIMQELQPIVGIIKGLTIPREAREIGLWLRPLDLYPGMSVRMVIEDGTGAMNTVFLGEVDGPQWQKLRSTIRPGLQYPLYLVSVLLFQPLGGITAAPGAILLDDIHVTVGSSDEERVLDNFEGSIRWRPILISTLSSDQIASTAGQSYRGRRAGVFSFGGQSDRGIRGFYRAPTFGPLPVVVSSALAAASGYGVGDEFMASVDGRLIPVKIKETVQYFPTLSPAGERFMLADLDSLVGHLNVLGSAYSARPNEIFLTEDPAAHQSVLEAVTALVGFSGRVRDRTSELESVRLDPLASAGLRAMVPLSLAMVLVTAGLGYATYLLSFASRRKAEMGFLQSLGLSSRQLAGLLGFEHLAVAAIGLGLGTWAGLQMSDLLVSPLAVTDSGNQVVPPFILTTDWSLMVPTYAAIGGLFLLALLVLSWRIGRLNLSTVARARED